MEELELKCFEIITNVGSAKSCYIEAIALAKEGKFDEAKALIAEGAEVFLIGHKAHYELIQRDAETGDVPVNLILMHAEDQLMNADGFKIIATEFVELYEKLAK